MAILSLAHNMCCWTTRLGGHDTNRLIVARTIRTRLIGLPGRLVNRAGQPSLRLPSRWPWGRHVHRDPRRARTRPDLTRGSRAGAPQNRPSATNPTPPKPASSRPNRPPGTSQATSVTRPGSSADHRSRVGGSRFRLLVALWCGVVRTRREAPRPLRSCCVRDAARVQCLSPRQ